MREDKPPTTPTPPTPPTLPPGARACPELVEGVETHAGIEFVFQPLATAAEQPPAPSLAEQRQAAFGHWGWEQEYSDFFLAELAKGRPILWGCAPDALPTIHAWQPEDGKDDHLGFGFFRIRSADFEAFFDAGGAMAHHGPISYTTVDVRKGVMPAWYDLAAVAPPCSGSASLRRRAPAAAALRQPLAAQASTGHSGNPPGIDFSSRRWSSRNPATLTPRCQSSPTSRQPPARSSASLPCRRPPRI